MNQQQIAVKTERVLYVWERAPGRFGGRLMNGTEVQGRYEECAGAEGVEKLALAFGKTFDRVEKLDRPIPWNDLTNDRCDVHGGQADQGDKAPADNPERNLVDAILRLNTVQRQRLLVEIATLPFEERVQFIEHCNDLAASVSRTMLNGPPTK